MKIGVISDTHMSAPSEELQNLSSGLFSDVSMILHAGDITRMGVLDAFAGKHVIAVSGNMDQYDVTRNFSTHQVITVHGYCIGLVHGWGSYDNIEERIMNLFQDVDAIVYGHSHEPANHRKNGVLLFNPGAYSGSRFSGGRRSVGILTLSNGIHGQIVYI
jgi:putative phosphoesterase